MIVIDNFDININNTLQEAQNAFYDPNGIEVQGRVYKGVTFSFLENSLKHKLENLLNYKIEEKLSFYRYYDKHYKSKSFIHSDLDFCTHIGVHFLNKDELGGGFATWIHKETKKDKTSTDDTQELLDMFDKDSLNVSKWKLDTLVKSKFNRLVVIESNKFHSYWPKQLKGDGPKNSRLVQVFFFNKL